MASESQMNGASFVPSIEEISTTNDVTGVPPNKEDPTGKNQMWQIFTDDSGEIQRKSRPMVPGILENPFNSLNASQEQSGESPAVITGIANPNANPVPSEGTASSADASNAVPVSHTSDYATTVNGASNGMPPPKPFRASDFSNGQLPPAASARYSLKSKEDIAVFQEDNTYTKFSTVGDHEEEIELITGDTSTHASVNKKLLIRSESDLDLVLPPANRPSLWVRLQWCVSGYGRWPERTVWMKAVAVAVGMCVAYALVVLILVKTLN